MNTPNIEQLAAAQKANTEVLLNLMLTAFNGVERLTALNIAAARDFFNSSVAGTQTLLAAKDPKALAQVNSDLAKPGIDKLMEYSRSVYELTADVQKQLTSVFEAQYGSFTKSAASAAAKASASAPVGGDVLAAAVKSVMEASTQVYDNINAVTKQLADIADSNMKAATAATSKAVTAVAKPAAKSATAAARKSAK